MPNMLGWAGFATVGSLILTACSPQPGPPASIAGVLGPGWNCLAAPSAFDGAGTIFRVTADGTKFTVADFSSQAALQRAPFVAPTATQTVAVSAGVVAQLIGLPISGNAAASDQYNIRQSFSDAQQVNSTDDGVQGIINAFYARPNLDGTQRYYLVRRAITARSVKYDFDKDIAASFGADISAKVIQVKPTAKYDNAGSFHYENNFLDQQNVCVLAEPLPVPRPPVGAAAAPVPLPPSNVPLFTAVGSRSAR